MQAGANRNQFDWCQSASSDVGSFVANASTCIDGIDPISYWRFDETAQPLADSFGRNNGACGNPDSICPTQTTNGLSANAQRFSNDLSTGIAVAGANGDFNWAFNESFSIAAWVKVNQSKATNVIVGRVDTSPTANFRWFLAISPEGRATARISDRSGTGSDESGQFTGTTLLTDDQWHYLVLVRDDSLDQNQLYVDGRLEASIRLDYPGSGGFLASNAPVNIGWLDVDTRHRLTGFIDEVAIYNQAMTSATIAKHFSNGQQGLGYCDP